ncbi:hypothetical protein DD237_001600 [Peronospora effusa]|uniref:Uncharacterized protein n=1 Tax=Peronospora effusa TaxID=542832 RepID=A0A425CKS8_9STRA|nr:hypothetical protein DD237_001600 [Peronospora effusa]
MPLCAQMLINRLSHECVALFCCEWEFEQVVQEPFTGLYNRRFMTALTMRTANFHPQRVLIHKMHVEMRPKSVKTP